MFRHPDHLPDRQGLHASITESLQNLSLDAPSLVKMSGDALKGIYGMNDDVILYWAHHEKLCVIDGRTAFMGGLDMCFGRWDTNQHCLSDVHPTDLREIVFPGQDYNNARVADFQDVAHWEQNQLDRKQGSRMGWSDISVSLHGVVVEDLRRHFVERWNFIMDTKYQSRNDPRYAKLALYGRPPASSSRPTSSGQPHSAKPQQQSFQQQSSQQQTYQQQPSQQQPPQQQSSQQSSQQHASPEHGTSQPTWQQPSSPPYSSPGNTGASAYPQSSPSSGQYNYTGQSFPPPPPGPPPNQNAQAYSPPAQGTPQAQAEAHSQVPYFPPPPGQEPSGHSQTRGFDENYEVARGPGGQSGFEKVSGFVPRRFREDFDKYGNALRGQLAGQIHQYQDRLTPYGGPSTQPRGNMTCQIVRSCAKWSNGTPTEHSIAEAYAAVIRNSEHFVYIENQFFITATGDAQAPVKNQIGAAIVERILRAARAGQKYKIVVVIPSVPCFAGDLADDSTLGTRAIMEFQYNGINRGGNSIMELIAKEGYNPMEYIRFYNLRNYDRINLSGPLVEAERRSGVDYEDARKQQDVATAGPGGYGPGAPRTAFDTSAPFQQYQQAGQQAGQSKAGRACWDSVSSCYMLHGEDLRRVPWDGPAEAEIDAFVTEELYVHSKVS